MPGGSRSLVSKYIATFKYKGDKIWHGEDCYSKTNRGQVNIFHAIRLNIRGVISSSLFHDLFHSLEPSYVEIPKTNLATSTTNLE